MQSQRFSLGVAGVLAACLFSVSAHANGAGVFGRSGKQGASVTCMTAGCHAFNPSTKPAPTLTLDGPLSLAAGATGNYTLTIQGGEAVKAGVNLAVSNGGGTLNVAGGDLKKEPGAGGELTHSAPKAFTSGQAQFAFSLVAPATAGTVKLFASGNSTNGNMNNDGDRATAMSWDIQVTGGTQPPDAGTPPPDGGTDPGNGGKDDDGGCSAAGGAPLVVLLALIAAAGLRRRTA